MHTISVSSVSYTEGYFLLFTRLVGSIKYLCEVMDICSFVGASTSLLLLILVTITEKRSSCYDSDSGITEPSSKKAC